MTISSLCLTLFLLLQAGDMATTTYGIKNGLNEANPIMRFLIDRYDAPKLVNPFTGKPDQRTHNGFTWKVTQADGSCNNVWEPGVYGWTKV